MFLPLLVVRTFLINKVGEITRIRYGLSAISGLPPLDTTALIILPSSAAALNVAAAPVLAPKYPIFMLLVC